MTYASLRLQAEPVEAFRSLARRLAAEADRDVPLSAVLALLVALGNEHRSELIERVQRGLTGTPESPNPGPLGPPVPSSETDPLPPEVTDHESA